MRCQHKLHNMTTTSFRIAQNKRLQHIHKSVPRRFWHEAKKKSLTISLDKFIWILILKNIHLHLIGKAASAEPGATVGSPRDCLIAVATT